jgi:Arc/MetJ-type ribon-helix-helix transcriptional regulator
MAVQIAPSTENLIDEMVASGQYDDAADVIEHAVQLLRQWDHNQRIIASVREAENKIRRGEGRELTDEVMEEIWGEAQAANRKGLPVNPDVRP